MKVPSKKSTANQRKFAMKRSHKIPPHLNGVTTLPCKILMSEKVAFPIYKFARDMPYDRQQLLWQKQVTVIGSIDLEYQIDEYHTGVAQLGHVVCHRRSVPRQRFAPLSLFFVAADAYSWSFCEFFRVANVNSLLSRIKSTSFSKCFEQLSLAWQFASISSHRRRLFKHFKPRSRWK